MDTKYKLSTIAHSKEVNREKEHQQSTLIIVPTLHNERLVRIGLPIISHTYNYLICHSSFLFPSPNVVKKSTSTQSIHIFSPPKFVTESFFNCYWNEATIDVDKTKQCDTFVIYIPDTYIETTDTSLSLLPGELELIKKYLFFAELLIKKRFTTVVF